MAITRNRNVTVSVERSWSRGLIYCHEVPSAARARLGLFGEKKKEKLHFFQQLGASKTIPTSRSPVGEKTAVSNQACAENKPAKSWRRRINAVNDDLWQHVADHLELYKVC